nr:MAG TPA: hypothetical protein [Inoviridae sp.]DAS55917.1 MAG TPA: hypothetical protein [Inoviridae sp.]
MAGCRHILPKSLQILTTSQPTLSYCPTSGQGS